ncbi:MAG: enoyl-CoA hydratase/isomerase family protein [Burkholderiaceae bacterium]|nr:enoyl-CoA hydratase/isomerase family protein [Burkholderiaceae bacterium]
MRESGATAGAQLEVDGDGIGTLTFDLPGKVNVMNEAFMIAMREALADIERRRGALRGVILASAKPTFFAGGDLAMMLRAEVGREESLHRHFDELKSYFRRLEKLGIPVVAAINGLALGGGYELCLAAHHRIALRGAKTHVALPEVQFGILPAAGGIVRLTRKLGIGRALAFLLSGQRLDVETALEEGLIDDVADNAGELFAKSKEWIALHPHPVQPWDAEPAPQFSEDAAHRLPAGFEPDVSNDAVAEIIDVAGLASRVDVDAAFAAETRGFVRLVLSANAKGRIAAFFEGTRLARSETQAV